MSKHIKGPWHTGRTDLLTYDAFTGEPVSSVYAYDERGTAVPGEYATLLIARVPGGDIEEEEEKANAALISAAPDFYTACTAEEDVTPLEWLSALLSDYDSLQERAINAGVDIEDPDAVVTMLFAVTRLLTDLRTAVVKAEGK